MSRATLSGVDRWVDAGERKLVEGLRRGEEAAFDQAYQTFRPRIYRYLARLTRDRSLAEDLLQETWLRLARHATRLEPETELVAWLFTVAHRLFVSHVRWRRLDFSRGMGQKRASAPGSPTPFDLASASETERRLETAVGELAPRYREVILLVVIEGFEPIEAARVLGLSPAAVRQRLTRARRALGVALGTPWELAHSGAMP